MIRDMASDPGTMQLLDWIGEAEDRARLATEGPWISFVEGRDHLSGSSFFRTAGADIELSGATVADQDFIAHTRQDVIALVEEIRRLHSLLEERKR